MQTRSLTTAGCASPVQVQSSNFSPGTLQSRSPTYSPEWVKLHDFSSAFQVCSCQQYISPLANLKSLMSWNRGLLQVQNIRLKKKLLESVQLQDSCFCPSAKCNYGHETEWLEYSWILLRSFGFKDCLHSNFQHIKTDFQHIKMGIFKFCIQNC